MNQLKKFLRYLRENNIHIRTNWQQVLPNGQSLDHCTIMGEFGYVQVIFHIWDKDQGFEIYYESPHSDFEADLKHISGRIN